MGQPKYCFVCDTIKVTFKRGRGFRKEATVLEYISNGAVVHSQTLPYLVTEELVISTKTYIMLEEPPKTYTVEDLMQMIAEKRG